MKEREERLKEQVKKDNNIIEIDLEIKKILKFGLPQKVRHF
jgi:hypothetical protein